MFIELWEDIRMGEYELYVISDWLKFHSYVVCLVWLCAGTILSQEIRDNH